MPLMSNSLFAQVLLPVNIPQSLWYNVPGTMDIAVGSLVLVPLHKRQLTGLVCAISRQPPAFATRPLCPHPSAYRFGDDYVETLLWCARYYVCSPNQALSVFWPKDLDKLLNYQVKKPKKQKGSDVLPTPLPLPPSTACQEKANQQLIPLLEQKGFRGVLLQGVTGSGKTRVYVELVQRCLAQGGRALILVPEIGLTPQTLARFQQHLAVEVLPFHSSLSAPLRRYTWQQILQNKAQVVLGTRSASLLPNLRPDLVIIDEEHDSSYKQQDPAPRYHVRELCFHSLNRRGGMIVLGSATPSLESWENSRRGHLRLIRLDQRAHGGTPPTIQIVNMREQHKRQGKLQLSVPLREALEKSLAAGEQSIILHNRRGYASTRVCLSCGANAECQDCKVPLTYHKSNSTLLCHYCNRCYSPQISCRDCGGKQFDFLGVGIEKVEEELKLWLPSAKVGRMDRDTVSRVGGAEKLLNAFRAGQFDILLGTQMVAKGHDFPSVRLVGVINADLGASLPDFRSSERLFQLITQVSGRAGRSSAGGLVLLQSFRPQDLILQQALQGDFDGFACGESDIRRELGYPPWQKMALLEASGRDATIILSILQNLANKVGAKPGITVLGPAEAFVTKVRNLYRYHLIFKATSTQLLRFLAEEVETMITKEERKKIIMRWDMDPQDLI